MSILNDLSNAVRKVVRVVKQVAEQAAAAQGGGSGGGAPQPSSERTSYGYRGSRTYTTPTSKGLPIASMRPRPVPLPRTARGLAVSRFWSNPTSTAVQARLTTSPAVAHLPASRTVRANVATRRGGGMPLAFINIGLPNVGNLAGGALAGMGALMQGDANVYKISRPGPSGHPYRVTDWLVRGAARVFGWHGVVDQVANRIGRTRVATKLNELSKTQAGRFGVRAFKKVGLVGEVVGIADYLKVRQRAYRGQANERDVIKATLNLIPGVREGLFLQDELMSLFGLTARAKGGRVRSGEVSLVGERGPEIVKLPAGTDVIPAHRSRDLLDRAAIASPYGSGARGQRTLHVHQYLDGREIALSTISDLDDDEQWGWR